MTPFWNTLILLTFVPEVVHVFELPPSTIRTEINRGAA